MFDVFYSGPKPNLFPHEQHANSIEHARELCNTRYFWWINYLVDLSGWDFLWEPVPWQAQQRHAWPSQHQPDSGIYLVPRDWNGETNYHDTPQLHQLPITSYWYCPEWIDPNSIDQRWSPDPMEPPYIYEFPVEWGWDNIGGPEYRVPGATERKFVSDFAARTTHNPLAWYHHRDAELPEALHRWRPNPADPPYDYVFGNQWYSPEVMPTVEYRVLGATSKKYITELAAVLPERHDNHWHTIEDCEWDYSWVPDPGDPPYIYVFGNQWWPAEKWPTVTYTVPGATERKYMDHPRAKLLSDMMYWGNLSEHRYHFDYSWKPDPGDPPYRYVFGNQWHSAEVMPTVEWFHPEATEESLTKYVDWPRAELLPNRTMWTIPEGVDEKQIDFSWVPDPGEPPYRYQFATQHQKTGGPVYTVPGATETKYLENIQIKIEVETVPIVEIDHLDGNAGNIPNTLKRIRYFDNYRDTLIRLAKSLLGEHEFVWVCSSICDYTDFDFTWHPEQWQQTMLHVFASNDQKFGDTFYMHVPTFAERAEKKALLEWYSVNFVPRKSVPRRPMPVFEHTKDTHVDVVKSTDWDAPLALFTTNGVPFTLPTVPLWRAETKTIVPLNPSASAVIVPKVARGEIQTQLYDYQYIDKTQRQRHSDEPMDIVFISYDEPEADRNWSILHDQFPRAHRVHGVAGMELALEAAADASKTPWYWAVFAKTELASGFDFSFVPDRMQQPKHYIFNCRNMVNGLEYGHMGMVLYNCQGIRDINRVNDFGLDYTLSFPHESIPILSCLGRFNTTPYHTWRTAFRETAKLAFFESEQPTVEGQYRLRTWLETARGDHAEWCLQGAKDGEEFFNSTNGELAKLKQSFRWQWLRSYFIERYGELQ